MPKNNERSGNKTQQGFVVPEKPKPRGCDDTIPVGAVRSPVERLNKNAADNNLITSAASATVDANETGAGVVTMSGERVGESLARELIVRRMAQEGIELVADMSFSYGDLLVTLDGYDDSRKIGYQFVSHSGADVVTDFAPEVEARLSELHTSAVAYILVIHDHLARDADAVLEQVELFLDSIPKS